MGARTIPSTPRITILIAAIAAAVATIALLALIPPLPRRPSPAPARPAVDRLGSAVPLLGASGLRSADRLQLAPGIRLRAELDGPAALVLAPEAVDNDPLSTSSWLHVELDARLRVAGRVQGRALASSTEDAAPGPFELRFRPDGVDVLRNGVPVFASREPLGFDLAHVYLLHSTSWDRLRLARPE